MLEEEFHLLTWISMVGLTLLNLPTFMFLGIVFFFFFFGSHVFHFNLITNGESVMYSVSFSVFRKSFP